MVNNDEKGEEEKEEGEDIPPPASVTNYKPNLSRRKWHLFGIRDVLMIRLRRTKKKQIKTDENK